MNTEPLIGAIMRAYAPPPDLTVSQWAEAKRRLPAASASKGARWSNATAPYLIGIMDATNDPNVRTIVVMGASQTGKSSAIHNAVGSWMEHDPSTVLWIMPSFDDAKRLSRGALADMIRSTPDLRAIVRGRKTPRGAEQLAESTLLEKVYRGGSVILAGSGTPNSFAGISARRAIGDDFERFEQLEEGAPDVLLMNRVESFYDGLVIFISTPLLVDGPIDAKFKTTDQRRYFLGCEACGHETYTTWSHPERFHVVYTEKDASTARLVCPGCGARHDEAARRRMVAAAAARPDRGWRPTATPLDPTAVGFHLPGQVSTLGMVTLERMTQQWLLARAGGPMALLSFVTTRLAEPWEDRGKKLEPHALATRLEDYGQSIDAPAGVVCLTAGVDVQIDRFEIQIIGWGLGGESWVVDVRTIPGDPTLAEVQTALLGVLDEKFRHANGLSLPILITAIDSGYLPEKVAYQFAFKRPRRIAAIKGVGGKFGEPSILKFDPRQPATANAVQPVLLNVDGLKLEVALGLEMTPPVLNTAAPGYMHLNRRCCDENYLAQLCAEHREKKKGRLVWVEDRPENHGFDTAGYARGALKLLVKMSGARTEEAMLTKMAEQLAAAAAQQAKDGPRDQPTPPTSPSTPSPRVGRSRYLGG